MSGEGKFLCRDPDASDWWQFLDEGLYKEVHSSIARKLSELNCSLNNSPRQIPLVFHADFSV